MDTDTILEVQHLSLRFDSNEVLHDVSFRVRRGEALAIIGPNGAGKTVLLRCLLGLERYSGAVRWRKGTRPGYVPQKLLVPRDAPITVREFFLLQSASFWRPRESFTDHVRMELSLVGLDPPVLDRPLGALSGGQLQRAMMAWAMLAHPDVLLLDEPTAGIDIGYEETIYSMVRDMQQRRGTTVVLISHDLSVVYRYADNVLCLNRRMTCQGPPSRVLTQENLAQVYGEPGFYRHETH